MFCISNTFSPRWLASSLRIVTSPTPGRDFELRVAITVTRAGQRVACQHRFSPFHMVDAERALRGRIEQEAVAQHAHEHAAGVPARGGEPAEQAGVAGRLVEMHRLRIEFAREFDDLVGGHHLAAEVELWPSAKSSNAHLLPVIRRSCSTLNLDHAGNLRASQPEPRRTRSVTRRRPAWRRCCPCARPRTARNRSPSRRRSAGRRIRAA